MAKRKKKPQPYRMMHKFWLNAEKQDELVLADYCSELRHKRQFTRTIRTGLELVRDLEAGNIEINSKAPIKGYRVKIHFGADKNRAKEIKGTFLTKFPGVAAYEKYDQPNFNIRVGDFRTKLEAYKFLKAVQIEFPTAFLVQDEIDFPNPE